MTEWLNEKPMNDSKLFLLLRIHFPIIQSCIHSIIRKNNILIIFSVIFFYSTIQLNPSEFVKFKTKTL